MPRKCGGVIRWQRARYPLITFTAVPINRQRKRNTLESGYDDTFRVAKSEFYEAKSKRRLNYISLGWRKAWNMLKRNQLPKLCGGLGEKRKGSQRQT